jgi:hypothetical protein
MRLTYSYIHTNYSEHMLFGLLPHAFMLIDTVYRDLTGPLVHTLCTLPLISKV